MENITIKLIDGTIDINKSKIKDIGIFKKMFDLDNTVKFIDYSDNEFMTKEAFINAMTLCSNSDKNIEKVMDFLDLEYNYILFEKFNQLRLKNFDYKNEKDLKLYFELINPALTELPHMIDSLPLTLVKKLVNEDNVDGIFTDNNTNHEYDLNTHLICHVERPDILNYLFECNVSTYKGDIGRGSGRTALYYTHNLKKFKMLVEYGFDLNYTDWDDISPLDFHKECENKDIVRYIKEVQEIELSDSDEDSD